MRSRSTGRTSARPGRSPSATTGPATCAGGMGRNRDSSLVAAHVTVAAGRDAGPSASRSPGTRRTSASTGSSPVWHFRQASGASGQWQNWYATEWTGADAIAARGAGALGRPARATPSRSATRSTARRCRVPVLDAAAANLSASSSRRRRCGSRTARSTAGRAAIPTAGSCEGSCTHVWNYQQALPFLFPALERSMRDGRLPATTMDEAGGMSFRLSLPLGHRRTRPSDPAPTASSATS